MTRIVKPNPLAILLQATRFMYFYSKDLGAYVRMRWLDTEQQRLEVEVCPPSRIHDVTGGRGRKSGLEYLLWNEAEEDGRQVISTLQFPYRHFEQYVAFIFDGEGKFIRKSIEYA